MEEDEGGERTLEPTQRKLDQAIEAGDVAKSQELGTWFVLAAGTLGLFLFAPQAAISLTALFRGLIANAGTLPVDGASMRALVLRLLLAALGAVGMPFLLLVLAATGGNAIQHRLVWSAQPLIPSLSKVSPLAGAKRLFGREAWINLGKGMVKLAIVAAVMLFVLWPQRAHLAGLLRLDVDALLPDIFWMIVRLLAAALAVLALIALGDYVYQRQHWYNRQRMTVQEVKEEHKQQEGSPEVKGRLRALRRKRAGKRMMAAVPTASVVITNPTHYAVALRYEAGMPAPVCIAKGTDAVALRIREVATANDISIVENPPLARALHATVEIDQEIPGEHYKAVAEVISFVMKLKSGRAWRP